VKKSRGNVYSLCNSVTCSGGLGIFPRTKNTRLPDYLLPAVVKEYQGLVAMFLVDHWYFFEDLQEVEANRINHYKKGGRLNEWKTELLNFQNLLFSKGLL